MAIILGGATDGSMSAAPVAAWMSLPSAFLAVVFLPQWQNGAGCTFCLFLQPRSGRLAIRSECAVEIIHAILPAGAGI
jgi:hypothetical protein